MTVSSVNKLAIAFVALVGGIYYYINYIAYPTFHFHFKLTVEVQTPDGIKSGSVVNESVFEFQRFGREFGPSTSQGLTRGEALFIDLGKSKNIIVSIGLDEDRQYNSPPSFEMGVLALALSNPRLWDVKAKDFPERLTEAEKNGPFQFDVRQLPTLLTLTDPTDYKSMKKIADPSNLTSSLGAGFEIKKATVELTHDALSEKIESELPWLTAFIGKTTGFSGKEQNLESSRRWYKDFKKP